jgi:ferredoxin
VGLSGLLYERFDAGELDVIVVKRRRGDPRGQNSKRNKKDGLKPEGLGDCIDCGLCVQVCPTGIDIRNGLQYECIGCAACIDVCNGVMDKMHYARGLVRLSTQSAMAQGWSRAQMLRRVFRPRVLLYGAGLLASLPTSADVSPTVGVYGELSVRDRLVLRVDGSVAPDARWSALASGQAWWPAASTSLSGRVRLGSGSYSTTLELGGGIVVYAGRAGFVTPERLYTLPQPAQAVAAATVRASMGGVGLRWTVLPWPDGGWGMLVGVDLERPGNVGVY